MSISGEQYAASDTYGQLYPDQIAKLAEIAAAGESSQPPVLKTNEDW